MKVDKYQINTMFAERTGNKIDLYGSYLERNNGSLIVIRSTKNNSALAQYIYGKNYSNDSILEKLKTNPTHNFIGRLFGPISMPINMEKVSFVD